MPSHQQAEAVCEPLITVSQQSRFVRHPTQPLPRNVIIVCKLKNMLLSSIRVTSKAGVSMQLQSKQHFVHDLVVYQTCQQASNPHCQLRSILGYFPPNRYQVTSLVLGHIYMNHEHLYTCSRSTL